MAVDPIYYVLQILFFVWGAVLLGFFGKGLVDELKAHSWLAPRGLWLTCLCCAVGFFVILQFDPRGILEIYSPNWIKFLEWVTLVALLDAFAFTAYMYLIVLYRQQMSSVPEGIRNMWLSVNCGFSVLHLLIAFIGSASNNIFWFAVDSLVLVLHEAILVIVLNVSICKLSQGLRRQTLEIGAVGTTSNFKSALRKIWYLRIIVTVVAIVAGIYQLFDPGNAIDRLTWGSQIKHYDNSKFSSVSLVSPLGSTGLYTLLLYMSRRPGDANASHSRKIAASSTIKSETSVTP
jgi:hypothetical protein